MNEQDKVRKALEEMGPGYELVRELGRGATAVVYLVRDRELDRNLAVKVIRSSFAHDDEAVARLKREARMVAQLQHPNIVRVFSTRHFPDGTLALLMEHVPGQDLREVLRGEGPFDATRTMRVLRDVASALAYAHRRRIVHRDVKPENIYVDDEVGTARLADFGIARPWDRDARLTVPGEALGTPAYMSPEQIDGDDVDGRTDVYSLGLVGYEMLSGEHPWEGDNLFTIIYKQKNEDLPPLRSVRPDVPHELADALERALRKDRDRRWESAEAFLDGLDAIRLDRTASADTAAGTAAAGPARRGAGHPATGAAAAPMRQPGRGAVGRSSPPDEAPAPGGSRGPRWRKGRVAAAALAVVLVAAGVWAWSGRGGDDGWASLDDLPETPATAEAPAGTTTDPEGGSSGEGGTGLAVVESEIAREGGVGSTLPLSVRVPAGADPARVRFRVVEGEGVLEPEVAAAGTDGVARTTLRLPEQPGMTTVAAALEGREDEEIRLAIRAAPGSPARAVPIVGADQVAEAGSLLPRSLGVRVVDDLGNPVPDAEVLFQVVEGGGSVAPARARTDTLGRAFARWRLGGTPGEQRIAALVPSAEEATVLFGAVARGLTEAGAGATDPDPASVPPDPPAREQPPADTGSAVTEAPAPRVEASPLAVGGTHVCVISAQGFARCGGPLDLSGREGAVRIRFAALAAGVSHVCGLDTTGAGYCWGANGSGQLGDGSRADREAPTPVDTPALFSSLALGLAHTCGIDGAGRVHCWGRNVNGQLGDGSRDDRVSPAASVGPAGMRAVVAGWNHTCALNGAGRAFCWGLNSDGQIGDGSRVDRVRPAAVQGGGGFSALAAGSAHTCGLGDGTVSCWGSDGSGQLGIGGVGSQTGPVPVEGLPGAVTQLVAGAMHTCGLVGGGEAWCWGQNIHGQLGDGTTTDRRQPVPVAGDLRFQSLEAGGGSTCGVANDGSRYCWGLNQSGQLGDGTRTNRASPARVGG